MRAARPGVNVGPGLAPQRQLRRTRGEVVRHLEELRAVEFADEHEAVGTVRDANTVRDARAPAGATLRTGVSALEDGDRRDAVRVFAARRLIAAGTPFTVHEAPEELVARRDVARQQ